MLLRTAKSSYQGHAGKMNELLSLSGIKECRREIYLFIDKEQFENERRGVIDPLKSRIALAFQVNMSVSDGRKAFSLMGRSANSSYIRMNVYTYDVVMEGGFMSPDQALFSLRSAFGSEIYRDYNIIRPVNEERASDVSIYNKIYGSFDQSMFADKFFSTYTDLVLPEFYNSEHMHESQHDICTIQDFGSPYVVYGSHLIDTHTELKYMDMAAWPSIERLLRGMTMDVDNSNANAECLISNIFQPVVPSMVTGATFIYDSEEGTNIIGGTVPFKQHRVPQRIITDLTHIRNALKSECETLEQTYGPIRVFYSPFVQGDKLKIIVKRDDNRAHRCAFDRDSTSLNVLGDIASQYVNE